MGINIFQQVGNNIQTVLKEKSLTQQHLANKLNISKQVMSKIVTGAKSINVSEISQIASALEVSVERLIDVKTEPVTHHSFSFMGCVKNEKTKEKIESWRPLLMKLLC